MRKIVFLVLGITMGFIACEEDDMRNSDIPSLVLNGFSEQFPNANAVEWDKKANVYEAEFTVENVDFQAIINPEGSVVKYKYELAFEALPQAIKATIAANFDSKKIDEIVFLQISENSFYQVEFDTAPNENKTVFEESGKVTTEIAPW